VHPHVRYLADEVAENHRDGLLSRREALRHLTWLGFSAVGAAAVLSACRVATSPPQGSATPSTTPTTAVPATAPTVPATSITYPGSGITVQGVFAAAASPKGAVLVVHENRGITDFIKSMTGRLAASGYTALAVDLLSKSGGTAAHPDPAELQSVLGDNAVSGQAVNDMKATLNELTRRAPGVKLGATGFCFGGNMVWDLLAAGDPPRLAAAVPFYGQALHTDFSNTHAAVLAIYAGLDTRVNANQPLATMALDQAHLTHQSQTFPGVGHAFMNNTGANYNPTQAAAGYRAMIDWFTRHLA
jgi:carboxymethylenebutenolidase